MIVGGGEGVGNSLRGFWKDEIYIFIEWHYCVSELVVYIGYMSFEF